jgi:hypothetical protein
MCSQDHAFRHYVVKYLRAMPLGYRRHNEPDVTGVHEARPVPGDRRRQRGGRLRCAPLHSTLLTLKLPGGGDRFT